MGWLIAIFLAILLHSARKELKALRARDAGEESELQRELMANRDLVVLRQQLKRMMEDEKLDESDFQQIADKIDACLTSESEFRLRNDERWWSCCEAGWHTLTMRGLVPPGPPPWHKEAVALEPDVAASPPASEDGHTITTQELVPQGPASLHKETVAPESGTAASPPVSEDIVAEKVEEALPILPPATSVPPGKTPAPPAVVEPENVPPVIATEITSALRKEETEVSVEQPQVATPHPPAEHAKSATAAREYAWRPAAPGPFERSLRAVSGWPKVLVPFLVQNIGWFIGTFLFLAGSVFLVTYTSGFMKAAIVFTSLFAYTLFLMWAGYKLLQLRTRLATAGAVLLATGMLLVPLTISAVTRLLMSAGNSTLLWVIGIIAALSSLAVFYIAAQVVSGIAHRSLRGDHPRLFLAGAAVQLGAPLIALWPGWQILALLHLLLLALLAYGLYRFTHEWLQSIFVDRKKVAFFAAGSLLYAVGTSFVHLTWGVRSIPLPAGYYAPYLMAVSGLLFYLDAQFKTHAHHHAFLSRFTFLIYGISVIAVLLSLDAQVARLITLGMAAALYAMVLAKYLTLIPLYLMIASLVGLYAYGILIYFPPSTYLLLATPGLYGLIKLSRWATQRGFSKPATRPDGLQRVGLITYRIALMFLIGLALWSIADSKPSLIAMATGLVLSGFLGWMLHAAPGPVIASGRRPAEIQEFVNQLEGPWLYAPVSALTVGLAFAPPIAGVLWLTQLAAVLMLLSALWATLFILGRRPGIRRTAALSEVFSNNTLMDLFASTTIVVYTIIVNIEISSHEILILAAGATLLFTLSVNLYSGWLFYASLLWIATTAVAVKVKYFPLQGVGIPEMLGVAVIWGVLCWLDRQPDELSLIAKRRAWRDAPRRLLWLFPCASEVPETSLVADSSTNDESLHSRSVHDLEGEKAGPMDERDV